MRFAFRMIIACVSLAVFGSSASAAPDWKLPRYCRQYSYAFGVHLAFTSFNAQENEGNEVACVGCANEMYETQRCHYSSNETYPFPPVKTKGDDLVFNSSAEVVAYRTAVSSELAQSHLELLDSYNLGVLIGIAEIQAASGREGARSIVISSLSSALPTVAKLGFSADALQAAINAANNASPMPIVYQQVVVARAQYQNSL